MEESSIKDPINITIEDSIHSFTIKSVSDGLFVELDVRTPHFFCRKSETIPANDNYIQAFNLFYTIIDDIISKGVKPIENIRGCKVIKRVPSKNKDKIIVIGAESFPNNILGNLEKCAYKRLPSLAMLHDLTELYYKIPVDERGNRENLGQYLRKLLMIKCPSLFGKDGRLTKRGIDRLERAKGKMSKKLEKKQGK